MGSREIPQIVFEILTRTKSLATLDKCKAVCKEWNQMIQESSFMATYCQRTRSLSGLLVQGYRFESMFVAVEENHSNSSPIVDLYMDDVEILASCNQGILCCVKRDERYYPHYYVCKPTTKQWKTLPNPKLRCQNTSVAITVLKSRPFRYKIIRLSQESLFNSGQYLSRCEVFDSQIWRWREAQPLTSELINLRDPSVGCGDSFYWLMKMDNVIQFNHKRESFRKFPLPISHNYSYSGPKSLCNYQGKLGLFCRTKERYNMELWVAETGAIGWTKKLVVNLENVQRNMVDMDPCPTVLYNADIAIFKCGSRQIVFYKLQDGSFNQVLLSEKMRDWVCEVFQFRSDLEPVELRNVSKLRGLKACFEIL